MTEKRKMLQNLLSKSFETHNPIGEMYIGPFMQEVSNSISEAIFPVNKISAPFIVAMLEKYAESIKNEYSGIDMLVKEIKEIPCTDIKVVIPHRD